MADKLDQDALEKVLKIMNFLDDLDDVQEVHTNAEFPDNFNKEEKFWVLTLEQKGLTLRGRLETY